MRFSRDDGMFKRRGFQGGVGAVFRVEPQAGFPRVLIRAVAGVAPVRQDGFDVEVIIDNRRQRVAQRRV